MALAPNDSASHNCGWLQLQAAQAAACTQIGSKVNFVVMQRLCTFARRTWLLERFVILSDFSYLLLMLIIIQDLLTQVCFHQNMRFDMVYWCVFTILHSLLLFILTFLGA